ncbi:tRNA (adenosine(37)-N6)-dimethylallyltransferase MiaA [Candidatus Saccharibacteria bacterium]|nr:tRNA (adenosine(37)-N6)-dimethylallyltransferase MiaA [Candidatus Saccharibacteria bacterium]
MNLPHTLVIVGPTASGKTTASIELAKRLDGEIISADSRAIYLGLDLGSAKPTPEEQSGIPHYGIDLVNPDERFTVADFQEYAYAKIRDIAGRGKLPILVGGSGLYVDAVIYNYNFSVQDKAQQFDRARGPEQNFYTVGITVPRDELRDRIRARAHIMFDSGIEEETKKLVQQYPMGLQAMRSNIYPIIKRLLDGEITRDEAIELFITDDWQLARRQMTWFKRNPGIHWHERADIVQAVLNHYNK